MHVALLMTGLPAPMSDHGGALLCWAVASTLVQRGHRVTVLSLYDISRKNQYRARRGQHEKALKELGVDLRIVEYDFSTVPMTDPYVVMAQQSVLRKLLTRFDRLRRPSLEYFHHPFPYFRSEIANVLGDIEPDVCIADEYEPLAAIDGLDLPPVMAVVGDLTHLPAYYRWWRESPPPFGLDYLRGVVWLWEKREIHRRLMIRMLARCDRVGVWAAHYTRWLQQNGAPQCRRMPHPISDGGGVDWQERRREAVAAVASNLPRILMIGALHGTATRAGLRLVARKVLPELERLFGVDSFELHIVGQGSIPEDVAPLFKRPSVRLRGYVEDIDIELLSADVFLVPTPITLGFRSRVIAAFSYGACTVLHKANRAGLPELVHEENSLVAASGKGLAHQIFRAVRDPELSNRIRNSARKTYASRWTEEIAGGVIADELESMYHGGPIA